LARIGWLANHPDNKLRSLLDDDNNRAYRRRSRPRQGHGFFAAGMRSARLPGVINARERQDADTLD
jgi:hypothetical protein